MKINFANIKYLFSIILFFGCFLAFNSAEAANRNFTISTWLKPSNTATSSAILVKDNEVRLITDASSRVACQIHDDTSWLAGATTSIALAQNEWQYVTCSYDGSNIKIYINSIQKASKTETGDIQNTTNSLKAGLDDSTSFNDFHGYLDEVKIYPYARTADQIKQDYASGLAGVETSRGTSASFGSQSDKWLSDGLVGYWKMDESDTTSGAIDSSGNSNDGVYYGNASTTGGKFGR